MKNVSSPSAENFEKTAVRTSQLSILANALLSLLKFAAGLLAHSSAMISDSIHSASDVLSSIVVIIGVRISAREADRDHPYGHERFECVAAIILSVVLCITGLLIGYGAAKKLIAGDITDMVPGRLALAAAILSIAVKEIMYHLTRKVAQRIDSPALMADAWHHRSDALSSVGALVGIFGARQGAAWLDTAASLVICIFIVKASADIFRDAIEKMVDHACDEELEQEIIAHARKQPGVIDIVRLQTREFGSRIYVELEIAADSSITLAESSQITNRVHDAIEERFPKVKHIIVHAVPAGQASDC